MTEGSLKLSCTDQGEASRANMLYDEIRSLGPQCASKRLAQESVATLTALFNLLPDGEARALLPTLEPERRYAILSRVPLDRRDGWLYNTSYPNGTVGYLMEPVVATFAPDTTVREVVEQLRHAVKRAFITYGYVVDDRNRLVGAVVMRELLFADPAQGVNALMIEQPFS